MLYAARLGRKLITSTSKFICDAKTVLLTRHRTEKYTKVQRSQHITQSDPRVYGRSYIANTSLVDGRRAFLGEEAQHDHIEYFQGFASLREKGLPSVLSAEKKAALMEDPLLVELQENVRLLETQKVTDTELRTARNEVRNCKIRLIRKTLG